MTRRSLHHSLALLALLCGPAMAQTEAPAEPATESASLLTDAELQTLVAPVALYPDTLLIQVLVASTYPLDVAKAQILLEKNEGLDAEALEATIAQEAFDPSVAVLATAFPTVVGEMAEHLDWTESVGNAMLAQSDDVMNAVQVLRQQAIQTGALVDSDQQSVTVEEMDATLSTSDAPAETVVIQPADPQTVYVPQYDPNVVYDTNQYGVGDALLTGAVAFGTVALIDEIFDDDDDWDDYWGCRNCAGWGGGPIYREPDIDIDVDGNVNVGNRLEIDRDRLDIDRDKINADDIKLDGNRIDIDKDKIQAGGWKPDPERKSQAQDKIAARRDEMGATTLPIERKSGGGKSQGDELREKLSSSTGARDITRPENAGALREASGGGGLGAAAAGAAGATGAIAGKELLKKSGGSKPKQISRPSGGSRPEVKKAAAPAKKAAAPAKKPAAAVQRKAPKTVAKKPSSGSIKKKASGSKVRKASSRGGSKKIKRR
ncbi:DUF3300 domain-containing protein [Tropicimonas sediminicola]|uniref:DUF3300 domain-containing protein n=1 Tax=Tropicimonas sediminicola TaxID=1031541 RepID=A0A239FJD7_9RHOB|nr:DUF3300 domain-containing protein [Tropicimonas sediminicola]SNS56658.1 Protein of unknown function [Tropicimonas sediminicola]